MTVSQFVNYDISGMTFDLIDATQKGCRRPDAKVLFSGDKNACRIHYGSWTVVSFESRTARRIAIHVRPAQKLEVD